MSRARSVIYKYRVGVSERVIPAGRVIHVGTQGDELGQEGLFVWVEHNLDDNGGVGNGRDMALKAVGTGLSWGFSWVPVGTAQFKTTPIVMHVLWKPVSR